MRAELGPGLTSPGPLADTEVVRKIREGGRVTVDDQLLQEVAYRYWFYTQPGQPSGAIKRMAEDFGRPQETIRTWVSRARKEQWLGPSVKGRAGAEAGPKLRKTLEMWESLAEASVPLTAEEHMRYFGKPPGPPASGEDQDSGQSDG
ncbi:hypothetical protein ACH4S8_25150 [Streptomyces sp. NPDC021080]|uniref:hypothetical protein n=1 Tax=Streptomyces sp. NPDC021080 TaxID=3365110 RepID=UPI0037ACC920